MQQFKYEYLKLNAADIVHIQYRVNQDEWSYMISTRVNEVRCNLCGNVSLGNIENIIPHIRSKRHMENMNRVIQMFHPSFTILDDEPNLNYVGRFPLINMTVLIFFFTIHINRIPKVD